MSDRELLTVSQFAEREGVSRQSVYKRLTTTLTTYIVKVDNTTYIDYSAYSCDKQSKEPDRSCQPCQPLVNPELSTLSTPLSTPTVDTLTAQISALEAALDAEKAARLSDAQKYADDIRAINDTALEMVSTEAERHAGQVAELTRQLEAERAERTAAAQRYETRIAELTDSLTDALTRAQQLQHEAQQLHAITAAAATVEPEPDLDSDTQSDGSGDDQTDREPKRSLWSRLFRR